MTKYVQDILGRSALFCTDCVSEQSALYSFLGCQTWQMARASLGSSNLALLRIWNANLVCNYLESCKMTLVKIGTELLPWALSENECLNMLVRLFGDMPMFSTETFGFVIIMEILLIYTTSILTDILVEV